MRKTTARRGAALLTVMLVVLGMLLLAGIIIAFASQTVKEAGDDRREKQALLCAEEGLGRGRQWVGASHPLDAWPAAFTTEAAIQADLAASALASPQTNCTACISAISDVMPNPRVYVYLLDNNDGDNSATSDNDKHVIVRSYCVVPSMRRGLDMRMVEALVDDTKGGTEYSGATNRSGNVAF